MPQRRLVGYPVEFLPTHGEETSSELQHLNATLHKLLSPRRTRLRNPWDSNLDLMEAIPPRKWNLEYFCVTNFGKYSMCEPVRRLAGIEMALCWTLMSSDLSQVDLESTFGRLQSLFLPLLGQKSMECCRLLRFRPKPSPTVVSESAWHKDAFQGCSKTWGLIYGHSAY